MLHLQRIVVTEDPGPADLGARCSMLAIWQDPQGMHVEVSVNSLLPSVAASLALLCSEDRLGPLELVAIGARSVDVGPDGAEASLRALLTS